MNFLKADIDGAGPKASLKLGDGKLSLKDYVPDSPMLPKAVDFGVRPEHIRINAGAEAGLSESFKAVVDIVEPMGSDSLVWLNMAGHTMSARVESNMIYKPGEKVTVRFRVGLASLFDGATGDRV